MFIVCMYVYIHLLFICVCIHGVCVCVCRCVRICRHETCRGQKTIYRSHCSQSCGSRDSIKVMQQASLSTEPSQKFINSVFSGL